jgi:hypothetical protein
LQDGDGHVNYEEFADFLKKPIQKSIGSMLLHIREKILEELRDRGKHKIDFRAHLAELDVEGNGFLA